MKEYTLLSICSLLIVIVADGVMKTAILKKREFYILLLWMFCMKLAVNGYLTAAGVVRYNPRFFLGIRLGSIPLEDFLFGFSMIAATIIVYEFCKTKLQRRIHE